MTPTPKYPDYSAYDSNNGDVAQLRANNKNISEFRIDNLQLNNVINYDPDVFQSIVSSSKHFTTNIQSKKNKSKTEMNTNRESGTVLNSLTARKQAELSIFSADKNKVNNLTARKNIKHQQLSKSITKTVDNRMKSSFNTQNGNNCRYNKFDQPNKFNFDLIHGEKDTNRDVYEQTVRKVVLQSLEGISGTVFVYGQTGTGKTYTMMGNSNPLQDQKNLYDAYENSGVLILSMQDLFDKIKDIENSNKLNHGKVSFEVKISYIEIYNE